RSTLFPYATLFRSMAGGMHPGDFHAAALIAVVAGCFGQRAAPNVAPDEEGRPELAGDRDLVHALAVDLAEIAHQAIDHIGAIARQGKSLAHGPRAAADIADLKIGRPVFARITENPSLPASWLRRALRALVPSVRATRPRAWTGPSRENCGGSYCQPNSMR